MKFEISVQYRPGPTRPPAGANRRLRRRRRRTAAGAPDAADRGAADPTARHAPRRGGGHEVPRRDLAPAPLDLGARAPLLPRQRRRVRGLQARLRRADRVAAGDPGHPAADDPQARRRPQADGDDDRPRADQRDAGRAALHRPAVDPQPAADQDHRRGQGARPPGRAGAEGDHLSGGGDPGVQPDQALLRLLGRGHLRQPAQVRHPARGLALLPHPRRGDGGQQRRGAGAADRPDALDPVRPRRPGRAGDAPPATAAAAATKGGAS